MGGEIERDLYLFKVRERGRGRESVTGDCKNQQAEKTNHETKSREGKLIMKLKVERGKLTMKLKVERGKLIMKLKVERGKLIMKLKVEREKVIMELKVKRKKEKELGKH